MELGSDEPVVCVESDGQYVNFPLCGPYFVVSLNTDHWYIVKYLFASKMNLLLQCIKVSNEVDSSRIGTFSSFLHWYSMQIAQYGT